MTDPRFVNRAPALASKAVMNRRDALRSLFAVGGLAATPAAVSIFTISRVFALALAMVAAGSPTA